ncbi:hypothetical protein [Catenulispora rubra]|uniref:hypothetical protein n=1 Tax=Catenulispora rubra TaxID=280293 RepID=UPI00189278A4|nr:hypothetical protein [Catenulispora rubra]
MSEYAFAPDPEACFDAARDSLEQMICAAREHGISGGWSADTAERAVLAAGRTVELQVLQGFHDTQAAGRIEPPVDVNGVVHQRVEPGHVRHQSTTLGQVAVHRLAFRALGAENLYPADAVLNLPAGLYSHEVAKLAAIESARGSFHDAAEALSRACGAGVAAPQAVRAMAISAAADFAAFYDHTPPMMSDAATLLVLSVDGKGIVMRPADLREATRKKAEREKAAGRLGEDGHAGRKRMATIGAVYDADPAPRRPHDIITLAKAEKKKRKKKAKKNRKKRPGPKAVRKWLTASVADDAAEVIKAVFDQAEARDRRAPAHLGRARRRRDRPDRRHPRRGRETERADPHPDRRHTRPAIPAPRSPHPAQRRHRHSGRRMGPDHPERQIRGRCRPPRRRGRNSERPRRPQENRRDRHLPDQQARSPALRHRLGLRLADRHRHRRGRRPAT